MSFNIFREVAAERCSARVPAAERAQVRSTCRSLGSRMLPDGESESELMIRSCSDLPHGHQCGASSRKVVFAFAGYICSQALVTTQAPIYRGGIYR